MAAGKLHKSFEGVEEDESGAHLCAGESGLAVVARLKFCQSFDQSHCGADLGLDYADTRRTFHKSARNPGVLQH
eukprot:SAG31_NODE_2189_length_6232_cov_11.011740_3_plen_74_part_00